MAMKMPLLFAALISAHAHAALDCASLKTKLESLNPEKKDWKEVEIPAAELASSLDALPAPHAPTPAELKARLKSVKADPEAKFPRYLDDNYANCTMRRAELRTALLKTASLKLASDKDRKRIADAVLATLKSQNKFPTLISALADARVLEFGLEQKIWSASKKDLDAVSALHQKVKSELDEENKTYGAPWNEVAEALKKLSSDLEKEKFLRESESFKKVRAHILAEPEESAEHLKAIRAFASKLVLAGKR